MDTKIKNNTPTQKNPPALTFGGLKYQKINSGWGLSGFFEGYKLWFSGTLDKTAPGHLTKFLSVFRPQKPNRQSDTITSIDLYRLFSPSAKRAWKNAYASARKRKSEISVEDVFLALLKESSVKDILARLNVKPEEAERLIINYLKLTPSLDGLTLQKIPFEAFLLAIKLHDHKVGTLMLLGGLLKAVPHDNILQAIFTNIGLTAAKLELFTVWLLDLNFEFPAGSTSDKFLYCLSQAKGLEQHFGYFFELPAIEMAVNLSAGQTLKDLQHLKALQLLVRAAGLAKNKRVKIISENLVAQAAQI